MLSYGVEATTYSTCEIGRTMMYPGTSSTTGSDIYAQGGPYRLLESAATDAYNYVIQPMKIGIITPTPTEHPAEFPDSSPSGDGENDRNNEAQPSSL